MKKLIFLALSVLFLIFGAAILTNYFDDTIVDDITEIITDTTTIDSIVLDTAITDSLDLDTFSIGQFISAPDSLVFTVADNVREEYEITEVGEPYVFLAD